MGVFVKLKEWVDAHKETTVWRVLVNKYFIATCAFFIFILFIDNNNIVRWIGTQKTLHEQREQIEFYRKEISSTENKLNQLKSKKDSLEAFAREEYYYSENKEDVYVVKHQE